VKHLEPDYEVETAPTGLIAHFWDTIRALGGTRGITLIALGIILFYFVVEYVITTSRKRREAKKKR
jgi:hypothetical protein